MKSPATTTAAGAEPLAARIVEALADHTETDPFSIQPPLYYSIDVDALERLFRTDSRGSVTFEHEDHLIVVDSTGTVTVDGTTYEPQ